MASTASAQSGFARLRPARFFAWLTTAMATLLIAGLLYWLSPQWMPLVGMGEEPPAGATEHVTSPEVQLPPSTVTLSLEKFTAAKIELATARMQALAGQQTVPAKIEYKPSEHIEVKTPTAAVVYRALVQPGQRIKAGAPLCVMTSAEIGLARDEVLAHEADLAIASKEFSVRSEVADNVAAVVDELAKAPALSSLESKFATRRLGEYRETILGAYSKLKLAEAVIQQTASIDGQGVISGRVREERHSAREVASVAFQTACEQALFAAQQQRDKAAADVAHSRRLHQISQQNLTALLGPFAEQDSPKDNNNLSEFTLCSPIDATVDERLITESSRVSAGQDLFILGNSATLWVSAEIHERDWKLVNIQSGQELQFTTPALPGRTFAAKVHHLGASISAETRAVPLVAEIDNTAGLFRPGMFAWVTIPYEASKDRLMVPASALIRHGELAMVFIPAGERTFARVDVQVGLETPQWAEITSGITAGQGVVSEGAFFLKSELLIERED